LPSKGKEFDLLAKHKCGAPPKISIKEVEAERRVCKVAIVNNSVFCACMEYFNTGIPCQHQFSLALRKNLKILFSERWFLEYERLAVKHPEKLHSSRI
jgi:hypothetical protein